MCSKSELRFKVDRKKFSRIYMTFIHQCIGITQYNEVISTEGFNILTYKYNKFTNKGTDGRRYTTIHFIDLML